MSGFAFAFRGEKSAKSAPPAPAAPALKSSDYDGRAEEEAQRYVGYIEDNIRERQALIDALSAEIETLNRLSEGLASAISGGDAMGMFSAMGDVDRAIDGMTVL